MNPEYEYKREHPLKDYNKIIQAITGTEKKPYSKEFRAPRNRYSQELTLNFQYYSPRLCLHRISVQWYRLKDFLLSFVCALKTEIKPVLSHDHLFDRL